MLHTLKSARSKRTVEDAIQVQANLLAEEAKSR